jgi:hypothetical protein
VKDKINVIDLEFPSSRASHGSDDPSTNAVDRLRDDESELLTNHHEAPRHLSPHVRQRSYDAHRGRECRLNSSWRDLRDRDLPVVDEANFASPLFATRD